VSVFIIHARIEFSAKMKAKPTRVAMDELQLHDLKNIEAAVDVQQNATPVRHELAIVVSPPAMGRDMRMPMVASYPACACTLGAA